MCYVKCKKVKWSRYRPNVTQRVGRGIALLFHDRGTTERWVVSNTPRPHFTPAKDPVPIAQEAGWACFLLLSSGLPWGEVWRIQHPPPPPKFRKPSKIVPNSTRLWKVLKIAEFRKPTPQDVRKRGSQILKLPPVCNCFTLAMTNKLVVIINSLKIPKIKKILLYEMKFLVPNYSCLQNPWLGAYRPQAAFSLSSVLNWICWTPSPPNKIPGYATSQMK